MQEIPKPNSLLSYYAEALAAKKGAKTACEAVSKHDLVFSAGAPKLGSPANLRYLTV